MNSFRKIMCIVLSTVLFSYQFAKADGAELSIVPLAESSSALATGLIDTAGSPILLILSPETSGSLALTALALLTTAGSLYGGWKLHEQLKEKYALGAAEIKSRVANGQRPYTGGEESTKIAYLERVTARNNNIGESKISDDQMAAIIFVRSQRLNKM